MRIDRRRMLQSIGSATTVSILAGCISVNESDGESSSNGSDSGSGGTATLWFSTDSATETKHSLADTFFKDSKHSYNRADIPEIVQKATNAIPAGKGPHTFIWSHDKIGPFDDSGFLESQGDTLDLDVESLFKDIAVQASQINGKQLALPFAAETVGLVYNKDMVDKPPKTYDELKEIMEKYHDPKNGKYGFTHPLGSVYRWSAWAHAFGGYYYDSTKPEGEKLGLTNDKTIKGIQFAIDNLLPYMPDDLSSEAQNSVFSSGKAPLIVNGPWSITSFKDSGIDVGVSKLPKPQGGAPKPYIGVLCWYFCSKMGEDKLDAQAAREFVKWWTTTPDVSLTLAKEAGYNPVLKEVAKNDKLPPIVKGYSEAINQGTVMPSSRKMDAIWSPALTAIRKIVNNQDADPKQYLKTAEKNIHNSWKEL